VCQELHQCRPGGADGTWRVAWYPATDREVLRGVRWLDACTPSRSGGNGRRKVATARSGVCIRGGSRHKLIASAKELFDLPIQLRHGTDGHRPARIDHDIPRRSQLREPGAHDFAHPPLEAIADNGFTDSARRGEANARAGTGASQAKSRKERPAVTETVVINFAEFARS
jgi:hypothetical protein